MPSGMSSSEPRPHALFYPTLFWKNVRRFWPLWAGWLLLWLFLLPLDLLTNRGWYITRTLQSAGDAGSAAAWAQVDADLSRLLIDSLIPGVIFTAVFGLFAAMAVFSYLFNARATGMLHSLPVRREGLFLTNWLSGFAFFAVPNLLVCLLTALAEVLVGGRVTPLALFLWFASMTLMGLFFYSFAVFCAMFTGHMVALPVFYGILNVLVLAMAFLADSLASQFLFGYSSSELLEQLATRFTPVYALMDSIQFVDRGGGAGPMWGFEVVLLYALVGAALTLLALFFYRRRQLETVGDVVAVSWVRPIFKYGVAFCSAVALGLAVYTFFFHSLPSSIWALLGFLVLCGLIGYFVAEMLLKKSFRVFKKSWKGAAGFVVALVALCCALELDLFGLENRVPSPGQVQSVTISYIPSAPYDSFGHPGFVLDDAQEIEAVHDLHAAIIANKAQLEQHGANTYESKTLENGVVVERASSISVPLEYTLRSGATLQRRYYIPVSDALLADPTSPAAKVNALLNSPDHAAERYFGNLPADAQLIRVSLDGSSADAAYTDLTPLYNAILADLADGSLGRRFLLENEERYQTCYFDDLILIFFYEHQDDEHRDGVPVPTTSPAKNNPYPKPASTTENMNITLQTTAKRTLAELERLGLIPPSGLPTRWEMAG